MRYLINTKVVGVSFKNNDGIERQELIKNLTPEDTLTIEKEENNPYDVNSHVIKNKDSIIGHVSRNLAQDLVNKVKEGQKLIGIKEFKVTGEKKHTLGVNITLELAR